MDSVDSHSSTSSNNILSTFDDNKRPLWRYVSKISKSNQGGGNWLFMCTKCEQEIEGTYICVKVHLMKIPNMGISACEKVSTEDLFEMKRLEYEFETQRVQFATQVLHLPCGPSISASQPSDSDHDYRVKANSSKKRKPNMNPISKPFDMQGANQLDHEIARMFFAGGLPLNLARNPYYISSFTFAANHDLVGYVPPGCNKLRTTLLQQEKVRIEKMLEPVKGTWRERGVSIVTDGWDDLQRRPLINFIAVNRSNAVFIKGVINSDEVKDKYSIADLMEKVIERVGHRNVVQILTDNVLNCRVAGRLIESMYPHIYWTPCAVHTLNLALRNICAAKNVESNLQTFKECHWIREVYDDALQVKNFIMNNTMRLAIFNRFTPLKLLSLAESRFASVFVMLKRLSVIRHALEAMVRSDCWDIYGEDDQDKARYVRSKVLDDDWWDNKVSYILKFIGPIYEMLRVCDTDKSCLHLVYEMWNSMIDKVKLAVYNHEAKIMSDNSSFFNVIYKILIDRWGEHITPLHCLAYSLNPRVYTEEWLHENPNRVPPHKDEKVSALRVQGFRRLFLDDEEYNRILDEYDHFTLKFGTYGDEECTMGNSLDPLSWWANFGAQFPLLQRLAFRLLGQPASCSCCERNWSTYSFVHSLKRNGFRTTYAEDLLFVHNNLRLLSRNSAQYHEERTKFWDVGGDEFGSLEDMGVLEFANLSLDEPELENVFVEEQC